MAQQCSTSLLVEVALFEGTGLCGSSRVCWCQTLGGFNRTGAAPGSLQGSRAFDGVPDT